MDFNKTKSKYDKIIMSKVTGMEINYLHVCKRKLWLYQHGVRPEFEHVNIQIGKHIQETTFQREEKDIPLGDEGVIDWASFKHGVIHETKKGKTPGRGDLAQVRYYMWWLHEHGVNIREAKIHYPKMKKTQTVPWSTKEKELVEQDIQDVNEVSHQEKPPKLQKFPYCKSCAYMEFCYA